MLRDSLGVPLEPADEKVVAYDWRNEPIYDWDGEHYFQTDDGWVMDDSLEIRDFMEHVWGTAYPIND